MWRVMDERQSWAKALLRESEAERSAGEPQGSGDVK